MKNNYSNHMINANNVDAQVFNDINITKILLLGKTGVGKSTFANFILKYDHDVFEKSGSGNSCTKDIQSMIGNQGTISSEILIIDSPGIFDSEKTNEEILKNIIIKLKQNFADGLNCILMLFNGTDPRFDEYTEKQIQLYLKIFPIKNFWSHISLVFTKCYEYFPQQIYDKMKEERINGFVSIFKEKVNIITEKFNQNSLIEYNSLSDEEKNVISRPEVISTCLEIKSFFVDTADVIAPYIYQRTNAEINKLIKWAKLCQRLSLDRTSPDIDVNFKKSVLLNDDFIKKEIKKIENEPNKNLTIKFYFKQYKKTTFRDEEITITDKDWYKKEEFIDVDHPKEIDENTQLENQINTYNPRKRQFFRPHYLLPDFKTISKRKKVRQNPYDINSIFIFENEEINQKELNENEKLEFKRDYINNNDIIYEEDYSEVEENNEDYIIIDKSNKKKINKCYLLTQRYDNNKNPIGNPKNKKLIGEETIFIKELIHEKEPIMIDDKNKNIEFETIQIITKEYSYDKPKVTLNPKVIKTETKYYKLNHYSENKSKSDSTIDEGQRSWTIDVTNTITKSYDRWDEVDINNNIINKGNEININVDGKISGGYRHENGCKHF
jgi:hypothetical protein